MSKPLDDDLIHELRSLSESYRRVGLRWGMEKLLKKAADRIEELTKH
jgi:hypothetical protein